MLRDVIRNGTSIWYYVHGVLGVENETYLWYSVVCCTTIILSPPLSRKCNYCILSADHVYRHRTPPRTRPFLRLPPTLQKSGFTVKPSHTAGFDHRYFHRKHHAVAASSSPPRLHSRRRPPPTMVGARSGGYGRFSDTDAEPDSSYGASPKGGEGERRAGGRDWQEIGNADVLVPKDVEFPLGVVHFVGGQGVGVFPRRAYGTLLEALVDAGEFCFSCGCVYNNRTVVL